uniref:Uncharacterized protein LOC105644692 n=1 Tax=Rhizophora mucronata TaxID=61149 RepID=A0A2P2ISJ6_RHIMU
MDLVYLFLLIHFLQHRLLVDLNSIYASPAPAHEFLPLSTDQDQV